MEEGYKSKNETQKLHRIYVFFIASFIFPLTSETIKSRRYFVWVQTIHAVKKWNTLEYRPLITEDFIWILKTHLTFFTWESAVNGVLLSWQSGCSSPPTSLQDDTWLSNCRPRAHKTSFTTSKWSVSDTAEAKELLYSYIMRGGGVQSASFWFLISTVHSRNLHRHMRFDRKWYFFLDARCQE